MPKLSAAQRQFLLKSAVSYHRSIPGSPAAALLAERGLADAVETFRLGFVAEPALGHERYAGMLAIPYLRPGHRVVSIRFRCVEPGCKHEYHGKYMSLPGDAPHLFNTSALLLDVDAVAVCEGELDAMSAALSGVPAVGVAGVEAWLPHFREPFRGYESVPVLADNDPAQFRDGCTKCKAQCRGHNPGMEFAEHVARELSNARILPWELGEDTNSTMVKHGREYIRERVLR